MSANSNTFKKCLDAYYINNCNPNLKVDASDNDYGEEKNEAKLVNTK